MEVQTFNMAAPVKIPILYTGENYPVMDFSQYDPVAERRIQSIQRQNARKQEMEAAQRQQMAKTFFEQTNAIERHNLVNEKLRDVEGELIDSYVSTMTELYRKKGGNVSWQELMDARRMENGIEQQLQEFTQWEKQHTEDLAFIEKNPDKIDPDAAIEIAAWDGNTPYNKSRVDIRKMSGYEIAGKITEDHMSRYEVNSFSQEMQEDGVEITNTYEYFDHFHKLSPEGETVIGAKHNVQMDFEGKMITGDHMMRQSLMHEFDNELDEDAKAFYIKAAMHGHKGAGLASDSDFTVEPTGVKSDAYKFYFHDRYGDMLFPVNKETSSRGIDKDKGDNSVKYKSGQSYYKDKPYLMKTKKVKLGGESQKNYFGFVKPVSGQGLINSVYTDPVEGEMYAESMSAEDYDVVGHWEDRDGKEWINLQVKVRGETKSRDGKELYRLGTNRNLTEAQVRSMLANMYEGNDAEETEQNVQQEWERLSTLGQLSQEYATTQTKNVYVPAEENEEIRNRYFIKKDAISPYDDKPEPVAGGGGESPIFKNSTKKK